MHFIKFTFYRTLLILWKISFKILFKTSISITNNLKHDPKFTLFSKTCQFSENKIEL